VRRQRPDGERPVDAHLLLVLEGPVIEQLEVGVALDRPRKEPRLRFVALRTTRNPVRQEMCCARRRYLVQWAQLHQSRADAVGD
jgi:hypothetical protein